MDRENLQCKVCLKTFTNILYLSGHMGEHFINYTCYKCGKGFATERCYRGHLRRHIVGSFKCTQCDVTFQTLTRLDNHRTKHKATYECQLCKENLPSRHFLKKHRMEQHGYGSRCDQCGIVVENHFLLRCHMRMRHEVRRREHDCEYCEKQFFDRKALNRHMVKHTGERNFVCSLCDKAFLRRKTLLTHLKIHYNDKSFVCSECGEAFVQKTSLNWHLKKHNTQKI